MIQYIYFLSIMSLCLCVDIFMDTHGGLRRHPHKSVQISPRVSKGTECPNRVAFMVSIQRGGKHVCSGTLLQAHWILTAAHCGTHGFKAVIAPKKLSDAAVICDYSVPHPNFDRVSLENDVQLVHLALPQYKHETTRLPYGIVDDENYKICVFGTVMGWGYMDKNKYELTDTLQCAEVETIPIRLCKAQHEQLLKGCICTETCHKGAANGDGGSPFMCGMVQFGIVSFGWGCETSLPVVYTSTHYHLDFIQRAVNFEFANFTPPLIPTFSTESASSLSLSLNIIFYCIIIILNLNLVLK